MFPNTDAGILASSAKLSIGTTTTFAPFSDSIVILSAKLMARSIAPPTEMFPNTASPDLRFFLYNAETIAIYTAEPIPDEIVEPSKFDT